MTDIIWAGSFETGHVYIDNQHRKLVGLYNELYREVQNCRSRDNIARALNNLANFAIIHFQDENGPDGAGESPKSPLPHDDNDIISAIAQLRGEVLRGRREISISDIEMISEWLIRHIHSFDRIPTAHRE